MASLVVHPLLLTTLVLTACTLNVQYAAGDGSFATQTVYGFLDFTTTIGNTVMVFSPQSAAPTPDKTTETAINAVIDTEPLPKENPPLQIVPSKTQTKEDDKPPTTPKIVTVVNVQSASPIFSSKVEVKSKALKQELKSVVNIAPVVSSKVEVVTPKQSIITKVEVVSQSEKINPPPILSSKVEVYEATTTQTPIFSSVVEVHTQDDEPAIIIGNNIGEPEYDFLSRQPSEVVEETYKVINLKPSSKFHLKPRASEGKTRQNAATKKGAPHPTGLVTKLGGTVVKEGVTTVHETSVIGTYISGKYAQVLQSTSHVANQAKKGKITATPTLRILKTAAPSGGKKQQHHLEPTPAAPVSEETQLPVENLFNSQNSIKSTRKVGLQAGSFKGKFKNRSPPPPAREIDSDDDNVTREVTPAPAYKKNNKNRNAQQHPRTSTTTKHNTTPPHRPQKRNKKGRKAAHPTTVSVRSEDTTSAPPSGGRKYQARKNKQQQQQPPVQQRAIVQEKEPSGGYLRRGYKSRIQATTVEQSPASSSVYKFKLNRAPGRWQYKTSPKPRVTIRKQNDDEPLNATTPIPRQDVPVNDAITPQSRSDDVDALVGSESVASLIGDEGSTENKIDNAFPLETIKVEISTPPDFKDTYYEIATIKSPYTFQVGSVKNTRYITVTSTMEKLLEPTNIDGPIAPTKAEPLTENILATTNNYDKDNNFLDSSVATLPPLYMAADMETPPLETMTETFSTTQTMLKTHILPVVRAANETSRYSLVQTYLVTRMVIATKTLPPMEAYHFVPSKTLNEFNSHLDEAGSELNLELAFGDDNDNEADSKPRKAFPGDLDLANVGSNFDLSDVDKTNIPELHLRSKKAHPPTSPRPPIDIQVPGLSPEHLQQLALLRLLNPGAASPGQVITNSRPVIKVETVYESHVLPVVNGHNTILSTISKAIGTVTKTDYILETSTIPGLPLPPVNPINPLFQQPQPQYAVTSSPIVQTTMITSTSSKILKLTFGAKTAYTTITSTKVIPTVLTTYMTASVPVQPTAAFPGYFPAPYPPFPYVG